MTGSEEPSRPPRRVMPLVVGLITAVAIFTGLAVGLYLPHQQPPSGLQLALATVASLLSGVLGWGQTRSSKSERQARKPEIQQQVHALAIAPVHLPTDIADFTDREPEIRRLTEAIHQLQQQNVVPFIVIGGIGGVGKSALTIHFAHLIKDEYPHGQLFINLRGTETQALNPSKVLASFLRALGIDGSQIPTTLDERSALFRTRLSGKRVLVVLDNAADEAQVRPLLPDSPGCAVLINGRVHLAGIEGATFASLDMMDEGMAIRLLSRIAGDSRIADDPENAQRIARLVGCLPLGLRIAGAKLATAPHLSLARLAGGLADERQLLSQLSVGDLAVEASLALSYQGLTANEKMAFRHLGLLTAASFPAWVIGPLLNDKAIDCEQTMERLVRMQLVQAADEDIAGESRYRFHDLVRAFARGRLREEESEAGQHKALARLLGAYVSLAERGARRLEPGSQRVTGNSTAQRWDHGKSRPLLQDELSILAWFTSERTALTGLVEQAYQTGMDVACCELAGWLRPFYDVRSQWDDWQRTHEIAIQAARRAGAGRLLLAATCDIANCFRDEWHWEAARRYLDESAALLLIYPDRRWAAFSDLERGLVCRGTYEWDAAEGLLKKAASTFRELEDKRSLAITLHYLGDIYRDQGKWREAKQLMSQSLPMFRDLGDVRWAAITEADLGFIAQGEGKPEEAVNFLPGTVSTFQRLGDRRLAAYSVHGLGDSYRDIGRLDTADEYLRQCIPEFSALGDRRGEAYGRQSLAMVHISTGDGAQADLQVDLAASIFAELSDPRGIATAEQIRGEIAMQRGDAAAAIASFDSALSALKSLGDLEWTVRASIARGDAYQQTGSYQAAKRDWEYAYELIRETGSTRAESLSARLNQAPDSPRQS